MQAVLILVWRQRIGFYAPFKGVPAAPQRGARCLTQASSLKPERLHSAAPAAHPMPCSIIFLRSFSVSARTSGLVMRL